MKQRQFSILFWISKNRIKEGKAPLSARITIHGERSEISLQRDIPVIDWNPKTQQQNGRSKEARELNDYLAAVRTKLLSYHQKLEAAGVQITAQKLKNEYVGIVEKPRSIVPIFIQHNENVKSLIGNGYARGTWVKFRTLLKHLEEFLKCKHRKTDIELSSITREFIYDFEFFLRSQKKIDLNTTAKYLQGLKKILSFCVDMGWLSKSPFIGYKFKTRPVDRDILTENELTVLQEKVFDTERLNIVKDIFLFSCYTGLAYIDVFNLKTSDVNIGIDGQKWIFTHRQKTETASRIPLLPPAMQIINKYADLTALNKNRLLPVKSNQKMNEYLKEIATCCRINKQLTFHIARHTFATTVTLSNGVPIETVSKMLGHKKLQTTQHYAKILDTKVSNDMQALFTKFSNSNEEKKVVANG
ncbi:MAG: site-specific integrase [Bacteroidetes bacterium]|nr:site-specific integrase [Bacteroidota bacterium]